LGSDARGLAVALTMNCSRRDEQLVAIARTAPSQVAAALARLCDTVYLAVDNTQYSGTRSVSCRETKHLGSLSHWFADDQILRLRAQNDTGFV
jgi:hypothetical protein